MNKMKKILLFISLLLLGVIFLFANSQKIDDDETKRLKQYWQDEDAGKFHDPKNISADNINVLLKELIKNKLTGIYFETGGFVNLNLSVYKVKNRTNWILNKIWFNFDDSDKALIVQSEYDANSKDFDNFVKIIEWQPRKFLKCSIVFPGYKDLILTANSTENKNVWKVIIEGRAESFPGGNNPEGDLCRFETVDEIRIKYKKILLPNLFRSKSKHK